MTTTKDDWWRGAIIYQIYPRSFKDTSGNGIGDLAGIIQKLDYIESLGVDAIWISPFYPSPMHDGGYDVSNFCAVDPLFGSLAEFDELVERAHKKQIRVLIDLVLSHSSDQHPWFKQSRADRTNDKADWYVWAEPKADGSPPNNWLAIFGGSAWEWDSTRRQYYLHNFLTCQPDLNFHCESVQQALLDVVEFWLKRGVDGFRLDTVNLYFHDQAMRNNPPALPGQTMGGVDPNNPLAMQQPLYSTTRPENLEFLRRFRALLDSYGQRTSVGEISGHADQIGIMAEYTHGEDYLHMCYVFDLMTEQFSTQHIATTVGTILDRCRQGWCSWALGNHDITRVISRWGFQQSPQAAATLTAMMSSFPGSYCMYQGEELALQEVAVPFEQLADPYGIRFWPAIKGRDGCRTPMPWNGETNSGFSKVTPWLPIGENNASRAVTAQHADETSVLNSIRHFLQWRKHNKAMRLGEMAFVSVTEQAIAFTRTYLDESILCAFNLSNQRTELNVGDVKVGHIIFPANSHNTGCNNIVSLEPWSLFISVSN